MLHCLTSGSKYCTSSCAPLALFPEILMPASLTTFRQISMVPPLPAHLIFCSTCSCSPQPCVWPHCSQSLWNGNHISSVNALSRIVLSCLMVRVMRTIFHTCVSSVLGLFCLLQRRTKMACFSILAGRCCLLYCDFVLRYMHNIESIIARLSVHLGNPLVEEKPFTNSFAH